MGWAGKKKTNRPAEGGFGTVGREREREREKGSWAVCAEKEIGKKKGFPFSKMIQTHSI